MAAGALQSLGSIAGEFSKGFMQGRQMRDQQSLRDREEKSQHVDRLFRLSDQVQDPRMKETLLGQAMDLMNQLESGKVQKQPKKPGIGSMLGNWLGFGKKQTPDAASGPSPFGPYPAEGAPTVPSPNPTELGPKRVSEDSNTFGSLGTLFAPQKTEMQPEFGLKGNMFAPQTTETAPSHGQPLTSFVKPPSTSAMAQAPKMTNVPELPRPPQATGTTASAPGFAMSIPPRQTPSDIVNQSRQANTTPRFGFYDPNQVSASARSQASEHMDELLGVMDAYLDHNPQINTFAQATADPNFGSSFRQAMDQVGQLEGSGLLEKDTLERWKQNRFVDARPAANRYGLDDKWKDGTLTPEERALYVKQMKDKAVAEHVPGYQEQTFDSLIKGENGKPGMSPMQAYTKMQEVERTPRQPERRLESILNKNTGLNEYAWITEGQSQPEMTGLQSTTQFDLAQLREPRTTFQNGIPMETRQAWSPIKVREAAKRNQIDANAIKLIIQEIKTSDPTGAAMLERYLQNPLAPQ